VQLASRPVPREPWCLPRDAHRRCTAPGRRTAEIASGCPRTKGRSLRFRATCRHASSTADKASLPHHERLIDGIRISIHRHRDRPREFLSNSRWGGIHVAPEHVRHPRLFGDARQGLIDVLVGHTQQSPDNENVLPHGVEPLQGARHLDHRNDAASSTHLTLIWSERSGGESKKSLPARPLRPDDRYRLTGLNGKRDVAENLYLLASHLTRDTAKSLTPAGTFAATAARHSHGHAVEFDDGIEVRSDGDSRHLRPPSKFSVPAFGTPERRRRR